MVPVRHLVGIMYEFVDRPVDSLCNGGRFTLWAMRQWARAASRGICPLTALTDGFAGMGVLDALDDFARAMTRLDRDALDRLQLAPMACRRICEHEAVLIALWRDAARGAAARLDATLSLLVRQTATPVLAKAMRACAAAFAASGLPLNGTAPQAQKESE